MASTPYHITTLLEKMTSSDKDYRFMACNDLIAELKKDVLKLDEDAEKRVAQMLLKLLQDKNGEVQNLAVKCLGLLVHKSKEANLFWLNETLCDNLTSKEEQLRDISSIALKTIIAELPPPSNSLSGRISHTLVKKLLAIFKDPSVDPHVQLESLDIISDLLTRYGNLLQSQHDEVLEVSLVLLKNSRVAVRKRSIIVISQLVTCCSQDVFLKLLDHLTMRLSESDSVLTYKTYIQAMGAITRQAGVRIASFLSKIIPLVLLPCSEETAFKDDELRECCLQTLESFIQKCPRDINQFIPSITGIALLYLSHDPNYYDNGEDAACSDEEVMETDQEPDSGDEYNNDDDYSDDDDVSWKVRRAAAKCISALISSRPDMLTEQYGSLSLALIKRFKEREDNVKADIFEAYITLLKQTKAFSITRGGDVISDANQMETESPIVLLQQQVPHLVRGVTKQIKQKSDKTRQCCFSLLTELVLTLPASLSSPEDLNKIIPALNNSFHDRNAASNLKIDILHFLHVLLTNHSPTCFHPHIGILCPLLVNAIQDSFYKITSEALLVTQQLVVVLRPDPTQVQEFAFEPYIDSLYQATILRLKATDIDQEVKERAISCTAQMIASLADKLYVEQLNECQTILLERLENEITRLTTVKGLSTISVSPLKVDISLILPQAFPLLASFLRKNQRSLKIATLNCLTILFQSYPSLITDELYHPVLTELSPLITEDDLHISQLVLILLTVMGRQIPRAMDFIHDSLLPRILYLLASPLLQGAAQVALFELFTSLVKAKIPSLTYESLVTLVTQPINSPQKDPTQSPLHKQGFHNIAKCVAALLLAEPSKTDATIKRLVEMVSHASATDQQNQYALLTIGEIGKYQNLSVYGELQQILIRSFDHTSEDVKSAAAYALGNISAGNVEQFVPYLLSQIQANPQHGYLLLQSLKEVIVSLSRHPDDFVKLKPCVEEIWSHMFQNCESPEEGKRQVVAECIGKLTLLDINDRLPKLEEALKSESPNVRATVVIAFKFTITEQPQTFDPLLKANIGTFLGMLEDPVLAVRRVALIALNSAAHNKPSLIKDMLGFLLPKLYAETNVRKELIRQVEMGPFKHTVDDGLDMRKAAFECMYTMLDSCLDRLDIFEFITNLEKGLKDHYDIKMLTYLMLTRLSSLCPAAILARLDQLLEGLKATIQSNVKPESVKQEYEKQLELKRSAIRAMVTILHIQDAIKNPKLSEFISQIKADKNLNNILESVMHDSKTMPGDSMDTS